MNNPHGSDQESFTLRLLLGLAAAGAVLFFMYLLSDLINNLFLALIVAIIASPLMLWLRSKGAPNWLAFIVTLLAVAGGVLLVMNFVITAAEQLATAIPQYLRQAGQLGEALEAYFEKSGLFSSGFIAILNMFEAQKAIEAAARLLGAVFDVLGNAAVIMLFVIFMLVQYFTTPRLMKEEILAGNQYAQRILVYLRNLHRYVLITAAIGLVTGALDTVWFLILGIPDAFIWGGLAALMSFVPAIGFWLAAIPPTLIALFEYGPLTALITLIGILIINGTADNVIKPRYIGAGLDLAPFMVIFSVIFWALILGPIGAIIGVPMTMLFKTLILEPDARLSWIARVTGSGSSPAESAGTSAE